MLAVGEINKVLEQLRSSKEIYEMSIEMSHGLDPVALYLYDEAKSPKKVSLGSSLDRDPPPHFLTPQAFSTPTTPSSTGSPAPLPRSTLPSSAQPPQTREVSASLSSRPAPPIPAAIGIDPIRGSRAPTRSQPPLPNKAVVTGPASISSRPPAAQPPPAPPVATTLASSSPVQSASFEIVKVKNFSAPQEAKSNLSVIIGPLSKSRILTLNIWMEGRAKLVKIAEKSSIAQLFQLLKNQEVAFGIFDDLDTCTLCACSPTGVALPAPDGTPLPPTSNLPLSALPTKDLLLTDASAPSAETILELGRHNSVIDNANNQNKLKICLPGDQYQVVAFTAEMTVRVLLRKVCEKRQLDTVGHYFYLKKDRGSEEKLAGNMLVKDIKGTEIWLGQGGEEGDEGKGPIRFWSEAEAFRPTVYNVTKMKKFGGRQERVMGIDSENITNSVGDARGKGGGKKGKGVKRPTRKMSEVRSVYLGTPKGEGEAKEGWEGGEGRVFTLEFKRDNKSYVYEAKSVGEAREITGKILYCMSKLPS